MSNYQCVLQPPSFIKILYLCYMCNKVKFSKKQASAILAYILKKRKKDKRRREKRIYHCPECNFWHLTSK